MLKIVEGGFRISTENGREILTIQSERIKECMDFFFKRKYDGIRVDPFFGFNFTSLNFLKDYSELWKEIKYISIAEEIVDITAMMLLTELKYISIAQKNPKVDFSHFPMLENLITAGGGKIKNLELCEKLESLAIYYYNSKSKDFSEIPSVIWIKEIHISNSSVINLNGLEKFNALEKASFHYCTKLEELCCLDNASNTLTFLEFDNCKKILNHDYIKNLKNLKVLALNDCGSIPSFQFVSKMLALKSIRFVGTNVLDGDLMPLLRLDYAGFSNKRHFSHTFEEIKLLNEKRNG